MIVFSIEKLVSAIQTILPFIPITILVTVCTTVFGSVLGGLLAILRFSSKTAYRSMAKMIIGLLRCTPPIVLLFLVYYGIPQLMLSVFHQDINYWSKGIFVVIAFTLLFAANSAELFRASYQAIPKGQREAGLSAGLSESQTFRRILFPQLIGHALPNFLTQILSLLKDGALAYTIGLLDIMGAGQNFISRNFGNYALETYLAITLFYWFAALILEGMSRRIEVYVSKGKQPAR